MRTVFGSTKSMFCWIDDCTDVGICGCIEIVSSDFVGMICGNENTSSLVFGERFLFIQEIWTNYYQTGNEYYILV